MELHEQGYVGPQGKETVQFCFNQCADMKILSLVSQFQIVNLKMQELKATPHKTQRLYKWETT